MLKLLQKSFANRVKAIYIDPPYNTGSDFVYPDNFQDNIRNYLELTGQLDESGHKLSTNPETSGRFHTDWLNMMYPRFKLRVAYSVKMGSFLLASMTGSWTTSVSYVLRCSARRTSSSKSSGESGVRLQTIKSSVQITITFSAMRKTQAP